LRTPEETIAALSPRLLKAIRMALPHVRNRGIAKNLMAAAIPIANELKKVGKGKPGSGS